MAYNEQLADRIREALAQLQLRKVDEKENVSRNDFYGKWKNVCECKQR